MRAYIPTIVLLSVLGSSCGSSALAPPTASQRAKLVSETRGEFSLDVVVTGLRSDRGEVLLALFASERGFPGDARHALSTVKAKVRDRSASARFSGLAPGSYAVSVLHDENASGSLDTGFLGIPSEGLGASNRAQGRFGPADFDDAKFSLQADRKLEIDVRYFP